VKKDLLWTPVPVWDNNRNTTINVTQASTARLTPDNLFLFHRNHPLSALDEQCPAAGPTPRVPLRRSGSA